MNNPDRVSFITPKNQKDCWYESIETQEKHIGIGDYAILQNGNILYDGKEFEPPERKVYCPDWLKDYYNEKESKK